MALYAQTLIEDGEGNRFAPGDRVPASLDGIDELKDAGAVADSKPELEVAAGDAGASVERSG